MRLGITALDAYKITADVQRTLDFLYGKMRLQQPIDQALLVAIVIECIDVRLTSEERNQVRALAKEFVTGMRIGGELIKTTLEENKGTES